MGIPSFTHRFDGRLVIVGFGSIGQGVLPLLRRHLEMPASRVHAIAADADGEAIARAHGVTLQVEALTAANFREVLEPLLGEGDFLLNLSVNVGSAALIAWCRPRGVLYLDTCIEPWAGGYTDVSIPPAQRSNYALREEVLALRRERAAGPTAVLTHGANPGLISHLVKQALLNLRRDLSVAGELPAGRADWAQLAQRLGVRVIHVAERDTQVAARRKAPGEFVNTWSVDGFVGEGRQPAELGWGTHEREFPADGARHDTGSLAAIYLRRPGAATRVRTWTPLAGPMHGFLITHGESVSIADLLTVGDPRTPDYRPTVHYAYHPCDDAVLSLHELAGRNWRPQPVRRVIKDDITEGVDELGALLMGHARSAYWFGSRLSIEEARRLAPHNSATSLQVTAAVTAAVIWTMREPERGIVEPEDLPHDEILAMCAPYLGELVGAYSDWTPLQDRGWPFDEALDRSDPWQFGNFRVN